MKNAIKYLVLSISCVICFVVLFIMVALLLDIRNLSYPATLILPMISYALFIGGFVILTIWSFKFSNNKEHKTFLIISLSVFLASALVFISAKIVNPIISETDTIVMSEEVKTECFDVTVTEFADAFESVYGIDLTPITVIDAEEKGTKIATYTCNTGNDNRKLIHYLMHYDETTENISYISFFFDKNVGDIEKALMLYYTHIGAIAEIIESTVDIGTIYEEISNVNGVNTGLDGWATYETEKFYMSASCDDTYFNASFTPIETYLKGTN